MGETVGYLGNAGLNSPRASRRAIEGGNIMQRPTLLARIRLAIIIVASAVILCGAPVLAESNASPSTCQTYRTCFDIGVLAYIYGYPLVMVGVTKQVVTNWPAASSSGAPINQFADFPLPNASFSGIVLPSVNTPYTNAFLDLSKGPIILHLPDLTSRFFLIQVLDAWTNVGGQDNGCLHGATGFCGLGTRYGTKEGDFAFVGPDWAGTLPPGITQVIQMATNTTWLAGRILTSGSPDDIAAVDALRQQFTLTPLRKYGKRYSPPTHSPVNPHIDMTTPPFQQVDNMDAGTFFQTLAGLMRSNPPLPDDAAAVTELAKIGFVPGQPFNIQTLDPVTRQALEDAYAKGKEIVTEASKRVSLTPTNWSMPLDLGVYGRRYLLRAATARGGLGANLYLDAVYAGALQDGTGQALSGAHQYVLHFDADKLPPVNPQAFWSVTLYNVPGENLFDNPIGRDALGIPAVQNHSVCPNPDGSLDFYIQADAPSQGPNSIQYCDWLPTPTGGFLLLLRMYWPTDQLFQQINPWVPPAVQRLN